MPPIIKYPVGQQSFVQIREGGYLYVDKTRYIAKLLDHGTQFNFLSRPRRFGKSLFLSTLKCFFEGRRELFKGLYIDAYDHDWAEYPVLYLDLNQLKYKEAEKLPELLDDRLKFWEQKYDVHPSSDEQSIRFSSVIKAAYDKTGKPVVILIDEYDKPLVNNIHNHKRFEEYRDLLSELYANFKSSADYIKLVFLTGVSRFGKLSVFSSLNNISDISFDDRYDSICGITEDELYSNFRIGLEELAASENTDVEKQKAELKKWYDGYHFSDKCPDIYNPYSLLNTMDKKKYANYWIESGTPSLLLEQLKNTNDDIEQLIGSLCDAQELSGLDIANIDLPALFYQTGYLTIKRHDREFDQYQLGLPNKEVTQGFFSYLLPTYAKLQGSPKSNIVYLVKALNRGEVDDFMKRIVSMFAGFSYDLDISAERDVRNAMFLLFHLIGVYTQVEYRTSDGRIDVLVLTDNFVYIIELKYDRSPEEAIEQIRSKEYALPWETADKRIIAIGINFSSDKRRIDGWLSTELSFPTSDKA